MFINFNIPPSLNNDESCQR